MTKEICDLFSMESLSGSPSTEHSTLSAHLSRKGITSQGLQAKPRKTERVDFISVRTNSYNFSNTVYTEFIIYQFRVPERVLLIFW